MSLASLEEKKFYEVFCSIDNNDNSEVGIIFEPRLLPSAHYGDVQLNQKGLLTNDGYLQQGENQLFFHLVVDKKDTTAYNQFSLRLKSEASVHFNTCYAKEISSPKSQKTSNKAKQSLGSLFFAYNDTHRPVLIAVGDFWPTEYYIEPYNWRAVFVSTDNQDIHIKGFGRRE